MLNFPFYVKGVSKFKYLLRFVRSIPNVGFYNVCKVILICVLEREETAIFSLGVSGGRGGGDGSTLSVRGTWLSSFTKL